MHVGKIYIYFPKKTSLLDDSGGRDPNDYTLGGGHGKVSPSLVNLKQKSKKKKLKKKIKKIWFY